MIKELITQKYLENEASEINKVVDFINNKFSADVEFVHDAEEIANIIISLKLDASSVQASLLFPFAKAGKLVSEEHFWPAETDTLLKMLIKCDELSKSYSDADGLKQMLLAIAKDIKIGRAHV